MPAFYITDNYFICIMRFHNFVTWKKTSSPPLPAHRVRINVPEDDFVETPSSTIPNQVQPSTKAKKKKKNVGKKSAPDPPSDSSPASKNLTQTLISAGLTQKKH